MKKYKSLLPLVLVLLMVAACFSMINNAATTKREYNSYIKAANVAVEKKISIDVDEAYSKALDINPNVDDYIKWGEYYYDNGDYDTAVTIANNALNSFSKESKLYEFIMMNYEKLGKFEEFFETYKKCSSIGATNKEIISLFEKNKYAFYYDFDSYDIAYPFTSGAARVGIQEFQKEGLTYGFVSASGSLTPQYKAVGDFNWDEISVAPVVDMQDNAYYINKEGRKKYTVSPSGIKVKELGMYNCKVMPVFDGQKYYLCNMESEIICGPYEFISTISDNIGVIKENGKFYIINEKGEKVVDQPYDDVILDSRNIAYRNGLFVKIGDKYSLVDKDGKAITNLTFDNACLFGDSLAAVENNGKWGFINSKGELVIDYKYHEAQSFVSGFAGVKMNGKWGYIKIVDKKDVVALDYQFDDAISFGGNGTVTLVKTEGKWKKLCLYYTD